jgi:hypothetical protein
MPVVVENRYYIRAGLEDEGLSTRRAASRIRVAAGQPAGRILLPAEESGLTFTWQCEYEDLATRQADAAWADASPEFSAVRDRMGTLLDRFERLVYVVDDEPLEV